MDFIYVLKLTGRYQDIRNWDDETSKVMDLHWAYLVDLHSRDIIHLVGRTSYDPGHDHLFGITVFTADDMTAAEQIMQADPAVVGGVMTASVHPFNLSLLSGRKVT